MKLNFSLFIYIHFFFQFFELKKIMQPKQKYLNLLINKHSKHIACNTTLALFTHMFLHRFDLKHTFT